MQLMIAAVVVDRSGGGPDASDHFFHTSRAFFGKLDAFRVRFFVAGASDQADKIRPSESWSNAEIILASSTG